MTAAAVNQLIASVGTVAFVGAITYIAAKIRGLAKYVKQHAKDHEWLMEQTAANTEAIAQMLGARSARPRPRRPPERGAHGR